MNNGWVKLHRKVLENIDLMNDDTAFLVFIKLLLMANSKGEVAESGRDLAERLGIKYSTLYKALKRLNEYAIIKQVSKHRITVIYICNWSNYQTVGKHFGKRSVSTGEALGKQTTGVSRIENKNKEVNISRREKYGKGYDGFKSVGALLKQKKHS